VLAGDAAGRCSRQWAGAGGAHTPCTQGGACVPRDRAFRLLCQPGPPCAAGLEPRARPCRGLSRRAPRMAATPDTWTRRGMPEAAPLGAAAPARGGPGGAPGPWRGGEAGRAWPVGKAGRAWPLGHVSARAVREKTARATTAARVRARRN